MKVFNIRDYDNHIISLIELTKFTGIEHGLIWFVDKGRIQTIPATGEKNSDKHYQRIVLEHPKSIANIHIHPPTSCSLTIRRRVFPWEGRSIIADGKSDVISHKERNEYPSVFDVITWAGLNNRNFLGDCNYNITEYEIEHNSYFDEFYCLLTEIKFTSDGFEINEITPMELEPNDDNYIQAQNMLNDDLIRKRHKFIKVINSYSLR